MAVLRNSRPPRMHPGCADPLFKKVEPDKVYARSDVRTMDGLKLYSDPSPTLLYFGIEGGCGCRLILCLSTIDMEKLLQYKVIHLYCTKKILEHRYPMYLSRNWR
jgi:hypothetical protein